MAQSSMQQPRVQQTSIKVDGRLISEDLLDALQEIEVDSSLSLPDMFVLRFFDKDLSIVDAGPFELGASVEIALDDGSGDTQTVMKGEITAIEPEYNEEYGLILCIRGYDRSHRLTRGTRTQAYIKVTDSDIAKKLAGENGLSPTVEDTGVIYEHVYQDNQTDLAFLQMLAARNGYEVFVDDRTLYFRPPTGRSNEVTLAWGENLRSIFPRLTLVHQVDEVIVRGWDMGQKKEVVGTANSSKTSPVIKAGKWGGATAQRAFSGSARRKEVRWAVHTQRQAEKLAAAILDRINSGFVEAEGLAEGTPKLLAGIKVKLENLGKRFSGTYFVTNARHLYTAELYQTEFRVEGTQPHLLADLFSDDGTAGGHGWAGVFPAIVTNNNDPEKLSRVKLKYPWFDDKQESGWARVATIGAGNDRGMHWMPEIDDEVLVAFQHGDFNYPYVIGNLYNGRDKAPEGNAVSGGEVNVRTIQSRAGNVIRMTDTGGSEKIEIIDATGKTAMTLDGGGSNLGLDSQATLKIKALGAITIESDANVTIKGAASVKIESPMIELNGQTVKISGSAAVQIQGAAVKIN